MLSEKLWMSHARKSSRSSGQSFEQPDLVESVCPAGRLELDDL